MSKHIRTATIYIIAALASGVFYREFTKFSKFDGITTLSSVHPHLFLLGGVLFLVIGLFSGILSFESDKRFRWFRRLYHIGLPLTAIMMVVRGIVEVKAIPLSRGLHAAISGMAGIGHIIVTIAIFLLLAALHTAAKRKENAA
ncbi:MAG: DUF2871 domain-containing protein [Bacillota bacterium]|nr:DUF2871 domain-containing protein [Bacillota bacterium]